MKKILYINGTMLDERPTGLGVYIKNVVGKLKDKNIDFKVFCPIDIDGVKVIKTTDKVKTSYKKKGGLIRFLWTQLVLPFKVKKDDVVYHPFQYLSIFSRAKQIITIHDFIPLYFPEIAKHQYYYYKIVMPILLRRAHKIVCISENTKKDIIKFYNVNEDKIVRVYNGYDEELFNLNNINENVIKEYDLVKPYFISVGAGYAHKNIESSLKAFKEILKTQDCDYVIVGKQSDYINKLNTLCEDLNIKENVKFVGYVPDEHLPTLYKKATAFVYPTLYEGFGLPILEAMACGTVVLCSNNSSLPEVYGECAVSFEATDIKEISIAMIKVLNNREFCNNLIEKSKSQINKFKWDDTANEIINIFNKL